MTPKEIGNMLKDLRDGKEVICPECKKGIIRTFNNPKTSHSFRCSNCKFAINMD